MFDDELKRFVKIVNTSLSIHADKTILLPEEMSQLLKNQILKAKMFKILLFLEDCDF